MVIKNSEAPLAATSGASVKTLRRNNDVNIVANSELNFHGISLQPVPDLEGIWLTANQIGYALQYADDKAVQRIYSRHADEFTYQMTGVVSLTTAGGQQQARVFSLRGAHLVAMFARTPVAKDFRRWLLDILDREVAIHSRTPSSSWPSEREVHAYNVEVLYMHYQTMYEAWRTQIEPALRAMESPLAGRLHDRFADGGIFMSLVKKQAEAQLLPGEEARFR
ncbi:Bro-N domain-containing protein [Franconibacter pulveris]|uniref:BRO-N domain-containing protein n=1 Tax=Franconibacter pulveris TaxID=435910 RepID=UPI00049860DD|nr:Bro-N domain-containing protein [Franconibacter pulveris]